MHLSSVGGLVSFNAFTREHGLHRELRRHFGRLKTGRSVVYPMAAQMQLLLDAWVAGAQRVLDVEMLAADPLFVHLAGGAVPSIDVLYDDLRRFDPQALEDLEELMSQHGTGLLKGRRHDEIFIDIDTTVMPLFGEQEGARPGPNPRYHGRPSYHPILAHIAQTGTVLVSIRPTASRYWRGQPLTGGPRRGCGRATRPATRGPCAADPAPPSTPPA